MLPTLRPIILSLLFMINMGLLHAQQAEIESAVKSIDAMVALVDGHASGDTLVLKSADPGITAAGLLHPDVKGFWHEGKLEKIETIYLGEAGKKWEAAYYFKDGQLVYLNSEYSTEMDYMGPGFYVVQYRNAHYLRDNAPFYRNFEGSDKEMPTAYKDVSVMRGYAQAYFKLLSDRHTD